MELEKLEINGLRKTYAFSTLKKEFHKAVNEPWKDIPPWKVYQEKLMEDLSVLEQEMEKAIDLACFEKLTGTNRLYSITRPKRKKNLRIIYTIIDDTIILITAFLENNSSDYRRAIELANRRLKWLESE